jgi:hypothetical protein
MCPWRIAGSESPASFEGTDDLIQLDAAEVAAVEQFAGGMSGQLLDRGDAGCAQAGKSRPAQAAAGSRARPSAGSDDAVANQLGLADGGAAGEDVPV